jgi:dienelactone hydrolase
MSIFPRSTWWSSSLAALCLASLTFAFGPQGPQGAASKKVEKSGAPPAFLDEFQGGSAKVRVLSLFLDDFRADSEPPLVSKEVRFPSAVGPVAGFWARQEVKQPLPAILIVYDDDSSTNWMKANARHLASIDYETLAVNVHRRRFAAGGERPAFTDEATLAELSAAVRWLRSRSTVLPNRLGVVGWGWSGGQALALASATSLQACVVCDAPLPSEPGIVVGLRETQVLAVFAGENPSRRNEGLAAFRKLLAASEVPSRIDVIDGVRAGFMGPPGTKTYAHDAAEDAWFAIYNFLEKHVEDARLPEAASMRPAARSVATIADIMRAVNDPAGLRGALGKALDQEPSSPKAWQRIRANAALMAEAGGWLRTQPSPKGPGSHWREQAEAFTAAAESIVDAADQRDYPAARRSLAQLAEQCAACHLEHR